MNPSTALAIVLAYLIGAIPLGLLLCLAWKGEDPRKYGSGNIGATNITRVLGPAGGVITFLLDVAKGYLAVSVAMQMTGQPAGSWLSIAAAVAALAGNNWPVWLKFKGGKGGSVSVGIGLAVAPLVALLAFAVWIATLLLTRRVSVATILAVFSAPVWALLTSPAPYQIPLLAISCGVAALVIYKHRANIQRLRDGTEPKFAFKKENV
jgi:glycerol-3-phosphate acyltransferase PlsY